MKVLILTTEGSENLPELISALLLKNGHEVVRLNLANFLSNRRVSPVDIELTEEDFKFEIHNEQFALSEFDVAWSRRFCDNFVQNVINPKELNDFPEEILPFLKKELTFLSDYILYLAEQLGLRTINNYDKLVINKLSQLRLAKSFGFPTPKFAMSNSLDRLKLFRDRAESIITKPASNLGYLFKGNEVYSAYTNTLSSDDDKQLPERFFPSFLQQRVSAVFEIKCVVIEKDVFAVKQFIPDQQIDKDIKLAFRENRVKLEEYSLPEDCKVRLLKLCKHLQLDLCTVDFIVDTKNVHYFLEINQDGMIEYYNNFLKNNVIHNIYQLIVNGKH